MIDRLYVRGFKRVREESFDLGALTVLAGLNGSGKTSIIQAFLLAWEASAGASGKTVRLNGPFGLALGTAEDVRNWESDGSIEIEAEESGEKSRWKFDAASDEALYLTVIEKPSAPPLAFSQRPRAFSYLCAERLGPRSALGTSPRAEDEFEVGAQGEHSAHILAALGDRLIEDGRRTHPTDARAVKSFLKYEVEAWLSEIAKPVEIEASRYPGSAITMLRYRSPGGDWVHAPNMGFGVSYALPVVLAGLISETGGLFVVENPEAHLHPAGQSRMGVFLAWLAGHGVQVLIETHSDHVINGIRRAIAEFGYLGEDRAVVYFFEGAGGSELSTRRLTFTGTGGISYWPTGFFDQYQLDVAALGQIRRRR